MDEAVKEVSIFYYFSRSVEIVEIPPKTPFAKIKKEIRKAIKDGNKTTLGEVDDRSIEIKITEDFYSFIKQKTNSIIEEDDKLTVSSEVQAKVISDLQDSFLLANPENKKKRCLQVEILPAAQQQQAPQQEQQDEKNRATQKPAVSLNVTSFTDFSGYVIALRKNYDDFIEDLKHKFGLNSQQTIKLYVEDQGHRYKIEDFQSLQSIKGPVKYHVFDQEHPSPPSLMDDEGEDNQKNKKQKTGSDTASTSSPSSSNINGKSRTTVATTFRTKTLLNQRFCLTADGVKESKDVQFLEACHYFPASLYSRQTDGIPYWESCKHEDGVIYRQSDLDDALINSVLMSKACHLAFDSYKFGIEPDTHTIHVRSDCLKEYKDIVGKTFDPNLPVEVVKQKWKWLQQKKDRHNQSFVFLSKKLAGN